MSLRVITATLKKISGEDENEIITSVSVPVVAWNSDPSIVYVKGEGLIALKESNPASQSASKKKAKKKCETTQSVFHDSGFDNCVTMFARNKDTQLPKKHQKLEWVKADIALQFLVKLRKGHNDNFAALLKACNDCIVRCCSSVLPAASADLGECSEDSSTLPTEAVRGLYKGTAELEREYNRSQSASTLSSIHERTTKTLNDIIQRHVPAHDVADVVNNIVAVQKLEPTPSSGSAVDPFDFQPRTDELSREPLRTVEMTTAESSTRFNSTSSLLDTDRPRLLNADLLAGVKHLIQAQPWIFALGLEQVHMVFVHVVHVCSKSHLCVLWSRQAIIAPDHTFRVSLMERWTISTRDTVIIPALCRFIHSTVCLSKEEYRNVRLIIVVSLLRLFVCLSSPTHFKLITCV
jgi:hypothetical protein